MVDNPYAELYIKLPEELGGLTNWSNYEQSGVNASTLFLTYDINGNLIQARERQSKTVYAYKALMIIGKSNSVRRVADSGSEIEVMASIISAECLHIVLKEKIDIWEFPDGFDTLGHGMHSVSVPFDMDMCGIVDYELKKLERREATKDLSIPAPKSEVERESDGKRKEGTGIEGIWGERKGIMSIHSFIHDHKFKTMLKNYLIVTSVGHALGFGFFLPYNFLVVGYSWNQFVINSIASIPVAFLWNYPGMKLNLYFSGKVNKMLDGVSRK